MCRKMYSQRVWPVEKTVRIVANVEEKARYLDVPVPGGEEEGAPESRGVRRCERRAKLVDSPEDSVGEEVVGSAPLHRPGPA